MKPISAIFSASDRWLWVAMGVLMSLALAETFVPLSLEVGRAPPPVALETPLEPLAIESSGSTLRPEAEYSVIVARTLFAADRRPSETRSPEVVSDQQGQETNVALTAVVTTGRERLALMTMGDSPDVVKMVVGDTRAGWKLAAVESDAVVLEGAAGSMRLELRQPIP